jgi:hypothetical protein
VLVEKALWCSGTNGGVERERGLRGRHVGEAGKFPRSTIHLRQADVQYQYTYSD